jgi:hypothetical protein
MVPEALTGRNLPTPSISGPSLLHIGEVGVGVFLSHYSRFSICIGRFVVGIRATEDGIVTYQSSVDLEN